MGLKSDSWIREKALKEEMITPFCENLVGEGVISYGLSSYGYDIRVSDEFKIFTNINAEVVDPKNFNNNNVVDFKGDICIVPPNSFALARTVEYIKMPKNTLAMCVGKCLSGESRVLNTEDGSYLPIKDFEGIKSTLSIKDFQIQKSEISDFIPNGVKKVYKLKTKAGLEIKATSNHPFLQIDGWKKLEDLKVGDKIAVAREIPFFGSEELSYEEAFHLALTILEDNEKFVPQAIFRAKKKSVIRFLQTLFSGDGSIYKSKDGKGLFLEYYSNSKRLIEDIHHLLLRFGIFALIREKITHIGTTAYSLQITDKSLIYKFYKEIGFYPNSIKQQKLEKIVSEISPKKKGNFSPIWDKIESIEYIQEEEVYDLTIPEYHNFIANGIIVHNSTYARCGIIVNVTPFEPEFEGYITIEISNTTPLPAKIYANEGIAQVLFFEGDAQCEVTYKTRKGKYQNQTGITLPRILRK